MIHRARAVRGFPNMCVSVEHMSLDFYAAAAAARLDDIKWVAPIFNGISLLFFLALFLVAHDGAAWREKLGKCFSHSDDYMFAR